ncbi:MAG: sulfite oxidase [Campylobacterota bacterium]|nr:sulfite oxidase [Campylobacterota bacterium]
MATNIKEIGIHEAYSADAAKADLEIFGREVNPETRRGFLKKSAMMAMAAVVGSNIPFADKMPGGLIPAALANSDAPFKVKGKEGLIYLNDRPINAETPPHLLDDDFTPGKHLFIRNNGQAPVEATTVENIDNWEFEIIADEGTTTKHKKIKLSIGELKKKYKTYTYALQIECGGNGRAEFNPPAKGNQWSVGAIGCPQWTGVRVKDILKDMGLTQKAIYIGYKGADTHLSGDPKKGTISRGAPIHKALEPESLLAWEMNGEPIPYQNGAPLRLVVGGWPASVSGKWLKEIYIRDTQHDGKKMVGQSYRVPANPVAPGTKVPNEDMKVIESMPVKSIVTFPKSGVNREAGKPFEVRGKAWAGDLSIIDMEVSIDFGASWQKANLEIAANRLAWQKWSAVVSLPIHGYYEVWARATDSNGKKQPMVLPGWNPRGYLNNSCHRIAVQAV